MDVAAKLLGQEVDNYAVGGSNGDTAGRIVVNPPFAYVDEPTQVTSRSLVHQVRPGPFEMHWTLCPVHLYRAPQKGNMLHSYLHSVFFIKILRRKGKHRSSVGLDAIPHSHAWQPHEQANVWRFVYWM